MAAKRPASKSQPASASAGPSPVWNLAWLGLALSGGLGLLVSRGRLQWPPTDLLAGLYTVAGCLALVGPLLLTRKPSGEAGLGELAWLSGGALVWLYDLASAARGHVSLASMATPLPSQPMGLAILAVMLAGWRARGAGRDWSWTNVVGWGLGLFWVGMGAATLVPDRAIGPVSR